MDGDVHPCSKNPLVEQHRTDNIENTELTIESNWTLAELERRFAETYEAEICFYEGIKRIHNDYRHIDEFGNPTVQALTIRGNHTVGDIIKRMDESFGLAVRIRERRYGQLALESLPLYVVRDTPRPQHFMEPLKCD